MNKTTRLILIFGLLYVIIKWSLIILLGSYLVQSDSNTAWLSVVSIPLFGVLVWAIVKRFKPSIIVHLKITRFRHRLWKVLSKSVDELQLETLKNETDAQFEKELDRIRFTVYSKNPLDGMLAEFFYANLLLESVEQKHLNNAVFETTILQVLSESGRRKSLLDRLISRFVSGCESKAFRNVLKVRLAKLNHPNGFAAELTCTDEQSTLAITSYPTQLFEKLHLLATKEGTDLKWLPVASRWNLLARLKNSEKVLA